MSVLSDIREAWDTVKGVVDVVGDAYDYFFGSDPSGARSDRFVAWPFPVNHWLPSNSYNFPKNSIPGNASTAAYLWLRQAKSEHPELWTGEFWWAIGKHPVDGAWFIASGPNNLPTGVILSSVKESRYNRARWTAVAELMANSSWRGIPFREAYSSRWSWRGSPVQPVQIVTGGASGGASGGAASVIVVGGLLLAAAKLL